MGQRPNRPKTKVVADPKYYFELLTSGGVELTNVNLVNNEVVEMFYTMKDPFVEAAGNTNQKAECRRKVCDWLKVTYANEA